MEDIEPHSDEDIPTPERDAVTPNERLHWHLTNALVSAESPETTAHLRGALSVYQDLPPTPLGMALYGVLTIAFVLGVLLLLVRYVADRYDTAGQ